MTFTASYLLLFWGLALHVIFDKRRRKKIRALTHQLNQLDRRRQKLRQELEDLRNAEDFDFVNQKYARAAFAVICLSGEYWRLSSRHFRLCDAENLVRLYNGRSPKCKYYFLRDGVGIFGEEGSFGLIETLSPIARALLQLPPKPEPAAKSVVVAPDVDGALGQGELPWCQRWF